MQWSLEDIYRKQVRGKITPRRHLRVLDEARVHVKFDNKEEADFELEDWYARQVLGFTAGAKFRLDGHIDNWLKLGKWSEEGISKAAPKIKTALLTVFDMRDPKVVESVAREIKLIYDTKGAGGFGALRKFLFDAAVIPRPSNLLDVFASVKSQLQLQYLTNTDFLAKLFQIDFSEGTVAVGPGEVALTLYSEAYNPDKGDLAINGVGEIEMKGSKGRVGRGTEALAVDRDYIKKATGPDKLEEDREKMLDSVRAKILPHVDKLKALPVMPLITGRSAVAGLLKIAQSRGLDVLEDTSIKKYLRTESPIRKGIEEIEAQLPEPDDNFISALQEITNGLYDIDQHAAAGMQTRFKTFWRGGEEERYKIYYEYLDKDFRKNEEAKGLIDTYKEKVISGDINSAQLVGAVSIANYQEKEGFKFIMFSDTGKKGSSPIESGRCPTVVIGPFTNYVDNLKLCLGKAASLHVDPNVERGSGFNVTVISA